MKTRCLLLGAVLFAACSGGSKGATSAPTIERTAPAVAIPNAVLFEGMLLGGEPSREHLERAKELGYRTVVDLRNEPGVEAERRIVEELGMSFVHLPVSVPEGLDGNSARELARVLDEHQGFFMIHCKVGERAAALMALKAACVDGKSVEEALAVGRQAGLAKLEPKVREALPARCGGP